MTVHRPLVIQAEHLDPDAAAWLAQRAQLVPLSPAELDTRSDLLRRAQGLVVRTYTRADAALLDRTPQLRVIGRAGVGLDNIDLPQCAARGIAVVHTPDANTSAVVEFVLAALLDLLRPRTYLAQALPADEWKSLRIRLQAPRQLRELVVGVYGLGKVGKGVARALSALGTRVLYHDLLDIPPPQRQGAEPVSRQQLLQASDCLTLHVDARPTNRGLIDAQALALCKPSAIILNTSRGFVADAPALAAFLQKNPAAAAVLDVHDPEPFDPAYPLLHLPNARLTPHIGAATALANRNMSWVVKDIWRVLTNQPPTHAARL